MKTVGLQTILRTDVHSYMTGDQFGRLAKRFQSEVIVGQTVG